MVMHSSNGKGPALQLIPMITKINLSWLWQDYSVVGLNHVQCSVRVNPFSFAHSNMRGCSTVIEHLPASHMP